MIFIFVFFIILFFFWIRNNYVFNWKLYFILQDNNSHRKLPSFFEMTYKYFWIWGIKNWKKFIEEH